MRKRFFVAILLILSPLLAEGQQAKRIGSIHTTVLDGILVDYYVPRDLTPILAADGKTLINAMQAVVYLAHPLPPAVPLRIPPPAPSALKEPETVASTFSIVYIPNGGADLWGEPCFEFPAGAQAAFIAAANIWANLVQSSVSITIKAGWADLGGTTLGYSGGGYLHRDFTGTPKAGTWYAASLANSLHGSDLAPASFDMHITYNKNFSWYFGTDGNTPVGQYDFMSVVLHEIAHGLNFAGLMGYSGGQGSWGSGTGYPNIYDTFMRDGGGNALTNTAIYANPSAALGSALTCNSVWFHGPNAMAANSAQRVKIYAPLTWAPGSSYSHLDYSTFAGTANRLMVYAISSASSIHDPGPVTKGLLKDLGWIFASSGLLRKVDFNGDGYEDILWRYVGAGPAMGNNVVWLMGYAASPIIPGTPGQTETRAWQLMREKLRTDIPARVYRDARESADLWARESPGYRMMPLPPVDLGRFEDKRDAFKTPLSRPQGATYPGSVALPPIPNTNWEMSGTGDFNNDGNVDILWRYYGSGPSQGANAVWYMNGTSFIDVAFFRTIADLKWRIVGAGDFNGDGKPDILWRYYGPGGYNVVWYMNGLSDYASDYVEGPADPNWRIEAVGDFDLDSNPDILWRFYGSEWNRGYNVVWYMNHKNYAGYSYLDVVPDIAWRPGGVGDFNRDGKMDVLWRCYGTDWNAGYTVLWYLNSASARPANLTYGNYEYLYSVTDVYWGIFNR